MRSGRCHIQSPRGSSGPRLGEAIVYSLGVRHPLIITRCGPRVTICEMEWDEALNMDSHMTDIPVQKVQAMQEAVLDELEGRL